MILSNNFHQVKPWWEETFGAGLKDIKKSNNQITRMKPNTLYPEDEQHLDDSEDEDFKGSSDDEDLDDEDMDDGEDGITADELSAIRKMG